MARRLPHAPFCPKPWPGPGGIWTRHDDSYLSFPRYTRETRDGYRLHVWCQGDLWRWSCTRDGATRTGAGNSPREAMRAANCALRALRSADPNRARQAPQATGLARTGGTA